MSTLQDILEEWQNNPAFREDFKKNRVQALQKHGMEVSPTDLAKFESSIGLKDNNSTNEALKGRHNI